MIDQLVCLDDYKDIMISNTVFNQHEKRIGWSEIRTHTFGIPVRRFTHWAIQPTGIGGEFLSIV